MDRAPEKPDKGQPCNGCGFCCAVELCKIAEMAGEEEGWDSPPCPLITFHDGRFWCRVVETEKMVGMEPLIAKALGIGTECLV